MMRKTRIRLLTVLTLLSFPVLTAAHADSVTTFSDSIIQPGGPRTTSGGTVLVNYFFNAEGSSNGSNASFAVADFSGINLSITSLSQLSTFELKLTEANAAFSHAGMVGVYLSTDTTTNIGLGSPLTYQTSAEPTGLGTQLNDAAMNLLGTYVFPQTGSGNNGTVDTINLAGGLSGLTSSVQSTLLTALTSGGTIRLVVAAEDATVSATWAGIDNTSAPGNNPPPTLVANAVPEPSSMILIGLSLLGVSVLSRRDLIRTRRRTS
jgi:hypothetical protein